MTKKSKERYDVLIIGGYGHIGLPFGIVMANAGFKVLLYDIDERKRAAIDSGKMPFLDYGAEPILKKIIHKTLHTTNRLSDLSLADTIIVTIGTPVDEYMNPKLLPIMNLAAEIVSYLHPGQHIMLRSTIYPGTAQQLKQFFKSRRCKINLSFCPERIVQGYAIKEFGKFPQMVSGFDGVSVNQAQKIFSKLRVPTLVVDIKEAELAKLFNNAWRYIQFAVSNQFYMMAVEYGANFDRIYEAMTKDYDRAKDFPKPGFSAGPCLMKDTLQLCSFQKNRFNLGHAAMLVNEGLPEFIVDTLKRDHKINFMKAKIGILGMAFKKDIDDMRDSLSYKLAKVLRFKGAQVLCSDEFIRDPSFVSKEELLKRCDVIIVGVPHSAYRGFSCPASVLAVDLWNVLKRVK